MKIKSLRLILTAVFFIGMLPQQGLADGHKKTMWDVITNDDRFATFAVMIENAGVQHLFNGQTAINATVYIPTNFAFSTMPQAMTSALRFPENKGPLIKLIKSHYFIGTVNNMKEGEYFMTTNINGDQIRIDIDKEKNLYVKDMIIQSEPIMVGRNKIIPIECVMFVQPSTSDYRLSLEQQEEFGLTSCCLRTINEVSAFVRNNNFEMDQID
ncbi:MAG: fasciclin domain-containing protein [Proteobacteria bacterium]|nr:fasciclin domain-containing protein [Pseudomonadota bacterium]